MARRGYEVMCMSEYEHKISVERAIYETSPTSDGAGPDRDRDRDREPCNAIIQPAIALMRRPNHQSQADVKCSYRESTTNGSRPPPETEVKLASKRGRGNESE